MIETIKKSPALKYSLLFAGCSILVTWTHLIPLINILPVILLMEVLLEFLMGDIQQMAVAKFGAISLAILSAFLFTIYFRLLKFKMKRGEEFSFQRMLLHFILQTIFLQPLGFYLFFLLGFGSFEEIDAIDNFYYTYPITSLMFVVFGLITHRITKSQFSLNSK